MTKPERLSAEAQAAKTPAEMWELFFTSEMQDLIVTHTNRNISDKIIKLQLKGMDVSKKSHIKVTKKVGKIYTYKLGCTVDFDRNSTLHTVC